MEVERLLAEPARPVSEFEWEELLVRLELMLRALRVLLEDADPEAPPVRRALEEMARREAATGALLEAMAAPAAAGPAPRDPPAVTPPPSGLSGVASLERFLRLRARNFAMVQRRGLGVWEWWMGMDDGRSVTAHQLLALAVAEDARALHAIRSADPKRGVGC